MSPGFFSQSSLVLPGVMYRMKYAYYVVKHKANLSHINTGKCFQKNLTFHYTCF